MGVGFHVRRAKFVTAARRAICSVFCLARLHSRSWLQSTICDENLKDVNYVEKRECWPSDRDRHSDSSKEGAMFRTWRALNVVVGGGGGVTALLCLLHIEVLVFDPPHNVAAFQKRQLHVASIRSQKIIQKKRAAPANPAQCSACYSCKREARMQAIRL